MKWEPLKDNAYTMPDGKYLATDGDRLIIKREPEEDIKLPRNVRLCRLVEDDAPAIPADILETLLEAAEYQYNLIRSMDDNYSQRLQRASKALAWLRAQRAPERLL